MPQFSANITTLFTEYPLIDRVQAVADCAFGAFEVQFPYEQPVELWLRAIDKSGIDLSVINIPVGDMTAGGPGLAAVPGRQGQFRAAIAEARLYAEALRPRSINLLAGLAPAKLDPVQCRNVLVENARYAAEAFDPLGIRVVVEAINTQDRPGFLIATSAQAVALLDAVRHPNIALQCDLYHMHIMGDPLPKTLETLAPRIGHVQFADAPGRHEPGTGKIDFAAAFSTLDRIGYTGWVAAEYLPSKKTEETLGWMKET